MTQFRIKPDRLDSLLSIPGEEESVWEPGELGEVLKHEMRAPLTIEDFSASLSDSPSGRKPTATTFNEILARPNPQIDLLEKVMRLAAARERRPGHLLPPEITSVLRFAAIAAARVHCGQRIGELDDTVLKTRYAELLKIPWLLPELVRLFEQALAVEASPPARSPGSAAVDPPASSRRGNVHTGLANVDPGDVPPISDYEILGRIGQGATSTVWRARHLETNREVALKLINASSLGPMVRRRFEREVEIAARMEHPHIARLYGSGIQGGYFFCAMELVDGVTLDQYVRDRKLDRRQILDLMATICEAVQYTHQRGVIHRDLKPANILVSADGQPHVLDFGLAKSLLLDGQLETFTVDGTVAGTLGFMSPQQAAGQSEVVDTRSDIYSLGAILYCLLTGRTPHDLSGSRIQAVRRAAEEDVIRPRQVDPTIDGEVEAVLLKALAREPAGRYSSAGAFADDLRHYLQGEPISARPPTLVYFLRKRVRRYRARLTIAAAVLLCLLGTAVYAFVEISAASHIARKNEQIAKEKAAEAERQAQVASNARALAETRLVAGLTLAGDGFAANGWYAAARKSYREAWNASGAAAPPSVSVSSGMLLTYIEGAPPLLGPDGEHRSAGGFAGHAGHVTCVAVSPNGKIIATGGDDLTVRLWDAATGLEIQRCESPQSRPNSLAFSPDGATVLTGCEDSQVSLWEVRTGKLLRTYWGNGARVLAVSWFPKGRKFISAGFDQTIRIFDVEQDNAIADVPVNALLTSVVLSPDGKLALSSSDDRTVRLWDMQTKKKLRDLTAGKVSFRALTVAFSRDGKLAAAGDDRGVVRIWNVADGSEYKTFQPQRSSPIFSLAFSPRDRYLVTGSSDRMVRIWEVGTGALTVFTGHGGPVRGVATTPDGKRCVSVGDDSTARLWLFNREAERQVIGRAIPGLSEVTVSADGRTAWTAGGTNPVQRWDIEGGVLLQDLGSESKDVTSLARTADGRFLIVGHVNGKVSLWDAQAGKLLNRFTAHQGKVNAVAISNSGDIALSGGDESIRVWDLRTATVLREYRGHSQPVLAVALSPNGEKALSGGRDQILRLWDVQTGKDVLVLPGHNRSINSVAFSHDGLKAISGSNDTSVRLWDVQTGRQLQVFMGHMNAVLTVTFSPDDQLIASASADASLTLWSVPALKQIRTFSGQTDGLRGHDIAPDGNSIISVDHGGTVRRWDLGRPAAYRRFEERLSNARESLARNPQDPDALLAFGEWFAFRGEWQDATTLLQNARAKGAAVSPLMLARCLRRTGQHEAAVLEFQRAISAGEAPLPYLNLCIQEARDLVAK
jgi:WD40 repeat protein